MHPRKRKIAIVLLSIGTLVGFGSGFASIRHRACARREAFEKHVAEVCVDAARRSDDARDGGELGDALDTLDEDGSSDRHAGHGHARHHGSEHVR